MTRIDRQARVPSLCLGVLTCCVLLGLSSAACAQADIVAQTFAQLDKNSDGQLSAEEYLQRPGRREMHQRDLALFDFDTDQRLSRAEFSAIPGLGPIQQRGAVPDPFDELRRQALEALDESYDGWDEKQVQYPITDFARTFAESLSPNLAWSTLLPAVQACDANANGSINRAEGQRFVKRQLGLFTAEGDRMRLPSGRVLDVGRFRWLDIDKGGTVSDGEYVERTGATTPNTLVNFQQADRDQDGWLNWTEYSDPQLVQSHIDLVDRFRRADTDFDARLSVEELTQGLYASQQPMAAKFFSPFDLDKDSHWSLMEFQLSPWGGPITSWNTLRIDQNRDGVLTFDEFLFNKEDYLLLQRLYFARFDLDGDGRLTAIEFPFNELSPNTLYRLAADGSVFEVLWRDKSIPNGGSPEISPDERWIAFDRYPDRKILRFTLADRQVEELCAGLMPTWSVDGQRFACSHSGVQIHEASGVQVRSLGQGWGAQWSPDGQSIAYELNNGLSIYDVEKQTSREVLSAQDHPYQTLYYGMTWSPDSRRVALKATTDGKNDLISIDTRGETPDLKVHFSTSQSLSHDIAWSPDGLRLVFPTHSAQHGRILLHQLDLTKERPPTLHPGIDTNLTYLGQSYSRDGSWLVVVAK